MYLCVIKHKQPKTMKATTILIAAVLSLQVSILIAGNVLTPGSEANSSCCIILVPITPAEATFEGDAPLMDVAALAPSTPSEADFSDVVPETIMDINILAPVTPAEADFTDSTEVQIIDFLALAPVTPAEADFE
jgi:hypothetical protein